MLSWVRINTSAGGAATMTDERRLPDRIFVSGEVVSGQASGLPLALFGAKWVKSGQTRAMQRRRQGVSGSCRRALS